MGKQWKLSDLIFWGSKITADGDYSHEIKRCLLLGRKVMTNLDGIFKSRDITLPTKVHLVKAMVFPVVMYDVKVGLWRKLSGVELMLLLFVCLFYFFFIFKLYITVLVLPNIKMNPPQVYMCSPSWTLLPPPSPYQKNWCFWTVVLEKTWESLGLQGDPTSPLWRRSALGFLWKEWC